MTLSRAELDALQAQLRLAKALDTLAETVPDALNRMVSSLESIADSLSDSKYSASSTAEVLNSVAENLSEIHDQQWKQTISATLRPARPAFGATDAP